MSLDNLREFIAHSDAAPMPILDASSARSVDPVPAAVSAFDSLGLHPGLLKSLLASGYTEPTTVQSRAIPEALAGHDLMVSSQTGSGKTAAFMLPALHKLAQPSRGPGIGPRMLVLTPTRELALQVTAAADNYGKFLKRVKTVSILGGMPYPVQNRLLRQPVDVLVATPGRLLDHLNRGRIDFSRLELLVLDEADRMLDMGFIEDIETIVAATPATRQTLLFSATLAGSVGKLAVRMLRSPQRIEVSPARAKHDHIEQRLHFADDLAHKNRLLSHLLRDVAVNQAVVFTATKRDADQLADSLIGQGFSAAALHGDMRQGERTRTLDAVRRGSVKILVATDVAARGIDVQAISHVINFDLPKQAEDYVHRIGRTGRAGRSGIAISLAGGKDFGTVKQIERFTAQPITVHVIPGLEPRYAGKAPSRKVAPKRTPGRGAPSGYGADRARRVDPPRQKRG
jgi:superfamily II DNA/RNA helicase